MAANAERKEKVAPYVPPQLTPPSRPKPPREAGDRPISPFSQQDRTPQEPPPSSSEAAPEATPAPEAPTSAEAAPESPPSKYNLVEDFQLLGLPKRDTQGEFVPWYDVGKKDLGARSGLRVFGRPDPKDQEDIRQEREQILAEARAEAQKIRERAEREGYEKGLAEGKREADEAMRAELAPILAEFQATIERLGRYRDDIYRSADREIFELALLIGKKVLQQELRLNREVVMEVVRLALERAVGWGKATVRVHPDDLAQLENNRLVLQGAIEGLDSVRFEADSAISRGGCVLESNFGEVDARIEMQLEEVERNLRSVLNDNESDVAAPAGREAGPEEEGA